MYGNFGIDANLANLTYLGWSWSDSVVMAIIDKYIGYVICPDGWLDWDTRSKLQSIVFM